MSPMSRSDARKRAAGIHKPRIKEGYPIEWFVFDESRTFHREWLHAMDAIHPPTEPRDQEPDDMTDHRRNAECALGSIDASDDPRNLPAGLDGIGSALLAIHDLLAERLPGPAEGCGCCDGCAHNPETCAACNPADEEDPDEALARVLWEIDAAREHIEAARDRIEAGETGE